MSRYRDFREGIGRFDALLLVAALWFIAKLLRYALPPLFTTFRAEFAVSNTVLGTAFTAMMLAYAAMQFPSGALADRVGATKVVTTGALVAAAGAFGIGLIGTLPAIVAGMVLIGLGTGVHKTVSMSLLAAIYPDRTGRALGAMDTFGSLGGAAAPAVVVAALATPALGWGATFLLAGGVGVVLAALFAHRVPEREPEPQLDRTPLAAYAAMFRNRRLLSFVAVTLLFSFAYNGAVAFLPTYLATAGGLSESLAGALYGGLFLASLVQPFTGEAADKMGSLPVAAVTLTLAALGLAALVAVSEMGVVALGVAVVAFGLGSHGYRPVRGAYLMATLPAETAGGGLGAVRTLLMAAGALSPAVVGALADAFGFRAAFTLLAGAVAGGAVITVGLTVTGNATR